MTRANEGSSQQTPFLPMEDQVSQEARATGSVIEFVFGNEPHSYFATSYPYEAKYAEMEDSRRQEL